jgi:hypothetical protein
VSDGAIVPACVEGVWRPWQFPVAEMPLGMACYLTTTVEGAARLAGVPRPNTKYVPLFLGPSSPAVMEERLRAQRLPKAALEAQLAAARHEYTALRMLRAGFGRSTARWRRLRGVSQTLLIADPDPRDADVAIATCIHTDTAPRARALLRAYVSQALG